MTTDRDVLVTLYYSTAGGAFWTERDQWGTDAELLLWYGVTANFQGRVVELRLRENNLQGTIRQPRSCKGTEALL